MTSDDIRNRAWFDTLSAKLGSTQLTHAVAKIEALERENNRLRKREAILVDAMAEVKVSDDGNDAAQPISRIVAGCISELQAVE